MASQFCIASIFLSAALASGAINPIHRVPMPDTAGFHVWIVDGLAIRRDVYPEFLYGGNDERYRFVPKGEIWIDHAIDAEEYRYTLAHELHEQHLMASRGMTYADAHDSSLALERAMRIADRDAALAREHALAPVLPIDCDSVREIEGAGPVALRSIYRERYATRGGIGVWIVDGAAVRRDVFPDFGLSGNDLAYLFIPRREIWIDGAMSCEEIEFSIAAEVTERAKMAAGAGYDDAYEAGLKTVGAMRRAAARRAGAMRTPKLLSPRDRNIGTARSRSSE